MFLNAFVALLSAASAGQCLHLRQRSEQPRVVRFDITRNEIPDRVEHDRRRLEARADTVKATLKNEQTLYALNISIGTPAQEFTVSVDTGSSDLWVNSDDSELCQRQSSPCGQSGVYNANDSSTYEYVNSLFNISYVDGSGASGDYVTDTLRVAGETIRDFQFGVGYQSDSRQGILGLGYPTNEAGFVQSGAKKYDNLPAKLASDGTIKSSAYSLWLNDLEASRGSLLFGGVDQSQYEGDLVTLPIQRVGEGGPRSEFYITLTRIDFAGDSLADDMALAVLLDSGTSLTYLPNDMVAEVYGAVDARYDESQGSAIVSCSLADADAKMTFHFDSPAKISVPMNELVLDVIDSGGGSSFEQDSACLFGISPSGGSSAVLGDTFLRSAYVVFDMENNEISLAQSRFNATENDIVEIGTGSDAVPDASDASEETEATSGLPSSPTGSDDDDDGAGMLRPRVFAALLAVGFGVALA